MKCSNIVAWLRANPGRVFPEELWDHASACPECRRLLEEQKVLEQALGSLPILEPPTFFETRLKAAVLGGQIQPASSWHRLLAPAAALVVLAAAAVIFLARGKGPVEPISIRLPESAVPSSPQEAPVPSPEPAASEHTAIYPVWPSDGDVVDVGEVSIMASLYPAPPPGTKVLVTLNNRDVSDRVRIEGEVLSFEPGRMEPGRHVVTITLREAEKDIKSLTLSFYALEAQS